MDDVSLQTIFRSVVIAKLMHASSALWGFAAASDRGRQRLAAFIRRSDRSRFIPAQTSQRSQTCATTPVRTCLQPSPATVITYITSCRHSPLVHKTTTCGNVHITSLSLLELVISLTTTLSNACYIRTYTSILLSILIHELNSVYSSGIFTCFVLSAVY